jgi:hypothetical protein
LGGSGARLKSFVKMAVRHMVTKSKSDLLSRLENATGKEKIEILNRLAGSYWDLPPNARIAFAEQAVDLSKQKPNLIIIWA